MFSYANCLPRLKNTNIRGVGAFTSRLLPAQLPLICTNLQHAAGRRIAQGRRPQKKHKRRLVALLPTCVFALRGRCGTRAAKSELWGPFREPRTRASKRVWREIHPSAITITADPCGSNGRMRTPRAQFPYTIFFIVGQGWAHIPNLENTDVF